jgi:hypothetical protein
LAPRLFFVARYQEGLRHHFNHFPLELDAVTLQLGFDGVKGERCRHHREIDPEDDRRARPIVFSIGTALALINLGHS